jgi:hypothetical protein
MRNFIILCLVIVVVTFVAIQRHVAPGPSVVTLPADPTLMTQIGTDNAHDQTLIEAREEADAEEHAVTVDQTKRLMELQDVLKKYAPPAESGEPVAAQAAPAVVRTAQPSFDCLKASTVVEHEICNDPALAQADADIADYYKRDLALPGTNVDLVRALQREWLTRRNSCQQDLECLSQMENGRLSELKGLFDAYQRQVVDE